MGIIYYLMGKSSSGKDTIFKELLKRKEGGQVFRTIVPYTTRPIREGEKEGVEYYFTDEAGFQKLMASGKVIEQREYHTFHGIWRYFTVDDGQFEAMEDANYLMIGTLEAYQNMKKYFGESRVKPVLIELDDGTRLERAIERERKQAQPKYQEMCRRFLADSEDFSEENIAKAGITRRFYNENLEQCLAEIIEYISENG